MENEHKPCGPYERFFKRPMDFILALTALIVLSPLLLILTIVGAIAMKGNPFFVQRRPGRINKKTGKEVIFPLIKFRTMLDTKDKDGNLQPDEVRLNKYGKFLRATSLDELPEILNIIAGQLAFVGPRPLLTEYIPKYNVEQHHRHDVRPGLTGFAQVHGRNMVSWQDRFKMDIWYTKNITFKTDISIFFATIGTVLKREGINSESSVTMEKFMGNEVSIGKKK